MLIYKVSFNKKVYTGTRTSDGYDDYRIDTTELGYYGTKEQADFAIEVSKKILGESNERYKYLNGKVDTKVRIFNCEEFDGYCIEEIDVQ